MKLFFAILFSFTLYSCSQNTNTESKNTENHKEHSEHKDHLSLDNGKKWAANKETTDGVQNMINLMEHFKDTDDVEAYHRLSENLKTQFKFIFEKCTMTGESHNQLHTFLLPIKKMFLNLEAEELATCKSSYGNLGAHLETYFEYFE